MIISITSKMGTSPPIVLITTSGCYITTTTTTTTTTYKQSIFHNICVYNKL